MVDGGEAEEEGELVVPGLGGDVGCDCGDGGWGKEGGEG